MLMETPTTRRRLVPTVVCARVMVGVAPLTLCPIEVVLSMATWPNTAAGALNRVSSRGSQFGVPEISFFFRIDCLSSLAFRKIGRLRNAREPDRRRLDTRARIRARFPQSWTVCVRVPVRSSLATTVPSSWAAQTVPSLSVPASPLVIKTSRPLSTTTSLCALNFKPSPNNTMSPLHNSPTTTGFT